MGNKISDISMAGRSTNTHYATTEPFRIDDWLFKHKSEHSDVYRHRWTTAQVEIFTIELTQKDDISLYELRKNTQSSILPRLIHYEVINNPKTPLGYIPSSQLIRVVIERLPFRLSTSTDPSKFHVNQAQLHELLETYQHIIQKFGNFKINSNMLAFAYDGSLRMWIHSNFCRNYPELPSPKEPLEQLIENIFQLTDSLTRNMYSDRKRFSSFPQAMQYLKGKSPRKYVGGIGQTMPQKMHIVRNNSFIPVNIVVMRTIPKMEPSETKNNLSGASQYQEHERKNIAHVPRHAINQLAGLGQNLTDASRKCSPNIRTETMMKMKGSSSVTTPVLRQVGQEQSKVTTNNSSIKTASPPKTIVRMVRGGPSQMSPGSEEVNRRRLLGGSVMPSKPIEIRQQSKPKVHFSFDNAKEQENRVFSINNAKKPENSLSNSFSKVTDSPVIGMPTKMQTAENYPLNRNIVFRHKTKQHITQHRYVTIPNDVQEHHKVHVQPSKAINIDDVNYHPLNFLKQPEKKTQPQLSTVVTIPTTFRHQKVQLYRPETFLPTSQPLIERQNSEPRVSRHFSQRPTQTLQKMASPLEKKQNSFQSADKLGLAERKRVETQQNEVQTVNESINVAVQKDISIKSSSTSQNNEGQDMEGSPLKRLLELRVQRQQNKQQHKHTIPSQRLRHIQKADLEPSTESKYNNTDKKEPPTDKKPLINIVKKSNSDQKHTKQEEKYQVEQTYRTKIETSSSLNVDTSKEPELPQKIKIIYSHLSENPMKSKMLGQRKLLRETIAVEPLPLQKISQPLSVAESEHSIPEPQQQESEEYVDSYDVQENQPPQVGFYHEVLNFHQSHHTDSHFLSKPTSHNPNQSTFSPSIIRNVPQTLNQQVVAILYDQSEPKPQNPLQYKFQEPQQTIIVNPGGIGFNIAKRETNNRIKRILEEQRIKRQDKQNKSSFERLLHDKGQSDLTSYLQRKLQERQRISEQKLREEERAREEERLRQQQTEEIYQPEYVQPGKNFYAQIVAHHEQHRNQEHVEEYMKDSYVQELQNYLSKHKKQMPLAPRSQEVVPDNDPKRITKQLSFGNYSEVVPVGPPAPIMPPEQKKKPISYVELTQDIRNLLNISQSVRQEKEPSSRKSSKQKTIQQKVLKKRSDFASLKEQVQRILYH